MHTNRVWNPLTSFLLVAFAASTSQADLMMPDYVRDSVGSSQLLTTNGGNGSILFEDQAVLGGSDLFFNSSPSNAGFVYIVNAGSNWSLGDTVNFTGLALPLWTSSTNPGGTNNNTSSPATLTFTLYSAGANNDWQGTNNLGTSDDSVIGSVDVDYEGTTISAYYVNFDSSVSWTADSSAVALHVASTGTMRTKTGNALTLAEQWAAGGNLAGRAASLAGTVVAVPEASGFVAMAVVSTVAGGVSLSRRRRPTIG